MYLLRHGQSFFNLHFDRTRMDPGIEDPELTPFGVEQALAAAAALATTPLTRIIVSPYTRALQTAQPFLRTHDATMVIMHEVRERAAFTATWAARLTFWRRDSRITTSTICRPMVARRARACGVHRRARRCVPRGDGGARGQRDHAARQSLGIHPRAQRAFARKRRSLAIRSGGPRPARDRLGLMIRRHLPLFEGLRPLSRNRSVRDALAGVNLACINVAQVLGYARIAGMPVDDRALYLAAASRGVRSLRIFASPRGRGRLGHGRDPRKLTVPHRRALERALRLACGSARADDGGAAALSPSFQAGIPRGFSVAHGTQRISRGRRCSGRHRHARRHAGGRGDLEKLPGSRVAGAEQPTGRRHGDSRDFRPS